MDDGLEGGDAGDPLVEDLEVVVGPAADPDEEVVAAGKEEEDGQLADGQVAGAVADGLDGAAAGAAVVGGQEEHVEQHVAADHERLAARGQQVVADGLDVLAAKQGGEQQFTAEPCLEPGRAHAQRRLRLDAVRGRGRERERREVGRSGGRGDGGGRGDAQDAD